MSISTQEIIQKWYKLLSFPHKYDDAFYKYLSEIMVSKSTTAESYDCNSNDGKLNLLSALYMCNECALSAKNKGISEKIILDTLSDIVTWTNTWSDIKGYLYLGEMPWLLRHLKGKLFRLGRLQFCMDESYCDIPLFNVKKGDKVLEVHIPEGEKLSPAKCDESFSLAKEFFAKHFPDFRYEYFTCHSWLLDDTLKKYLSDSSNVIAFGNRFTKVASDDSYDLLKYVFRWDVTPETLTTTHVTTRFAQTIKDAFLQGEKFHTTLGVIKK